MISGDKSVRRHHLSHQPSYLPLKFKNLIEALKNYFFLLTGGEKYSVIALMVKPYCYTVLRVPLSSGFSDRLDSFLVFLALGFKLLLLMAQLVMPLTWDQKYYSQADPRGGLLVGTADRRGIKNLDEQDLSLIKRICFQTRMVRLEKKV